MSGLFTNKAVVQIDGGALRTLTVGQATPEGIKLVAVDRDSAVFEIDGRRTTLGIGQAKIPRSRAFAAIRDTGRRHSPATSRPTARSTATPIRFMVDTGATITALPAADARRMAIDLSKGQPVLMRTANGTARGRDRSSSTS